MSAFCTCAMPVHVGTHAHLSVYLWRLEFIVKRLLSNLFMKTGFLISEFRGSAYLCTSALGLRMHTTPGLYMGAGDPNTGSHVLCFLLGHVFNPAVLFL